MPSFRGKGFSHCLDSGCQGRIALYEVLIPSDRIASGLTSAGEVLCVLGAQTGAIPLENVTKIKYETR